MKRLYRILGEHLTIIDVMLLNNNIINIKYVEDDYLISTNIRFDNHLCHLDTVIFVKEQNTFYIIEECDILPVYVEYTLTYFNTYIINKFIK